MDHGAMSPAHMEHGMSGHGAMTGFLGPYVMTREASGTSWQPDTSPHEGLYRQLEEWSVMTHGSINLNYDRQPGARGADKTFVSGMLMTMAQRPLGDGTFGVRAMMSPEPFMGASGYPLLLATGETADGTSHLVDRQHPHDLFMELAATYSRPITANSSVFIYGGLPGEPALGPPAFMHRLSGMDNPEAPISHHWLDSTHITFGVVTAGVVLDNWKFEASTFRGREPDQYRYDIERPYLDSFAGRVSWNPARELSLQVSYGHINSPEQLAPAVNENRLTASAIYTTPFGDGHLWSTTVAWGRKMLSPGDTLDGYLLESSAILKNNWTLFMRAERVAENELTDDIVGLEGRTFTVGRVSVGGIYDFVRTEHAKFGIGGLVSRYVLPNDLKPVYGRDLTGFMVFGRIKLL
jgi:cyclophilin family peptidyl-prolyl cis-trans isomerase